MFADPRYLSQLAAIVEAGSFAAAAARLGLTQPALSRNIRILEDAVGARLLHRSRNGVRATEVGLKLAGCGQAVKSAMETAAALADGIDAGTVGELRLASIPFLANSLLAEPLGRFLDERTGITTHVELASPRAIDELLASHRVDLALTRLGLVDESSDIRLERLMSDEMLILCRAGHPLTRLRRLTAESLREARWISYPNTAQIGFRHDFERTLAILGLTTRHIAMETEAPEFILDVLERSEFLTLMPKSAALGRRRDGKIAALTAGKPLMLRPIGFAYRPSADQPAVREFIQHFKAALGPVK